MDCEKSVDTCSTFDESSFEGSSELLSFETEQLPLVQRLGGKSLFQYIILVFCEKLLQDKTLEPLFKKIHESELAELHQELIEIFFDENAPSVETQARVIDLYHPVFRRGLKRDHFDQIVDLFTEALEEGWICPILQAEARYKMNRFRGLFEASQRNKIWRQYVGNVIATACH